MHGDEGSMEDMLEWNNKLYEELRVKGAVWGADSPEVPVNGEGIVRQVLDAYGEDSDAGSSVLLKYASRDLLDTYERVAIHSGAWEALHPGALTKLLEASGDLGLILNHKGFRIKSSSEEKVVALILSSNGFFFDFEFDMTSEGGSLRINHLAVHMAVGDDEFMTGNEIHVVKQNLSSLKNLKELIDASSPPFATIVLFIRAIRFYDFPTEGSGFARAIKLFSENYINQLKRILKTGGVVNLNETSLKQYLCANSTLHHFLELNDFAFATEPNPKALGVVEQDIYLFTPEEGTIRLKMTLSKNPASPFLIDDIVKVQS
ncbi:hypothetical protein NDN08_005841 [Rhodosorus marinus]|uniref:Uncharacterized protein n=1 Tax=Rhodosorus marinus TaxID=101924 RepID=A0AAV8V558_9RHOD|nr:hypothetical protein NDN08_005841 [Rhodosorus marinus]